MTTTQTEHLLRRLYTNPKFGVAFQGVEKIFRKAREFNANISRQEVDNFLRNRSSYSIFSRKLNRFPRRTIFSRNAGKSLSIDLMEFSADQKRSNRPFTFLYVSIDIFSGYGTFFPLKKKNIEEILLAMKKSFEYTQPDSILCDKESAIYSHEIKNFLNERKIRLVSQLSVQTLKYKNGHAESAIRFLRRICNRFCEENKNPNFVSYLKQITEIFNSHVNRRTGKTPQSLRWDRSAIAEYQEKLTSSLAESAKKMKDDKSKSSSIKIGSLVHVRELNNSVFAKEGQKGFSRQTYMVVDRKKTVPFVFKLYPPVPNQRRFFYAAELFLLPPDHAMKKKIPAAIERISSKKQLRNKTLYQCSMIGSGDNKIWLTRDQIINRFILIQNELSREVLATSSAVD